MNIKGFTLIELVIVVGIFGILAVVSANFFVTTLQSSNRASIENDVRQNANKIMADMVTEIRKAKCVSWTTNASKQYTLSLSDAIDPLGVCDVSGSNRVVYKNNFNGQGDVTKTVTDALNVVSSQTLTSGKIAVLNCPSRCTTALPATCTPGIQVSGNNVDINTVSYTMSIQAQQLSGSRSDFCGYISLTESVSPRNLNQ